jgi:hypothetical protein
MAVAVSSPDVALEVRLHDLAVRVDADHPNRLVARADVAVTRNSFVFTGHVRGRALRPGQYRLVATPIESHGRTGKSRRAGFRVRR